MTFRYVLASELLSCCCFMTSIDSLVEWKIVNLADVHLIYLHVCRVIAMLVCQSNHLHAA